MGVYIRVDEPVPALCFTANTAGSTIRFLNNGGSTIAAKSFETSTDGLVWSSYTRDTTITLTNVGDKIYFRNSASTGLSISTNNYAYFIFTGEIKASGDVSYLLSKDGSTSAGSYCFYRLFNNQTSLVSSPKLPFATVSSYCFYRMFNGCSNLIEIPKLPAITLTQECYREMFRQCTKIKLSTTQTGEYQTPYRIPTEGTGTTATNALFSMFISTGGTFTGTPDINTTYYTSNTVV